MSVEQLDTGENSQHIPSGRDLTGQVEEGHNEDDLPVVSSACGLRGNILCNLT